MTKNDQKMLTKLFQSAAPTVFVKGDVIPINGNIHLIASGFVGLVELLAEGHKKLVFIYRTGEMFPSLYQDLTDSDGRKMYYTALDTVTIWSLSADSFKQMIMGNVDYCCAVMRQYAELLQLSFERIGNLGNADTMTRLATRLVFSARRFGVTDGNKTVLQIPLTHTDIALAIGTSRETVNRLMRKLERRGIIEMRDRLIVICSMDRLMRVRDGQGV